MNSNTLIVSEAWKLLHPSLFLRIDNFSFLAPSSISIHHKEKVIHTYFFSSFSQILQIFILIFSGLHLCNHSLSHTHIQYVSSHRHFFNKTNTIDLIFLIKSLGVGVEVELEEGKKIWKIDD